MPDGKPEDLEASAGPVSPASSPASQLLLPWTDGGAPIPERLEIHSRRYLGSKLRLLPFLHRVIAERCGPFRSFGDLFAGTGVVAHSFNRPETRIVANDYLASNAVSLRCWLETREIDPPSAARLIDHLNRLPAAEENYVSEQYGGRYFTRENARKIGAIRDEIDRLDLPESLAHLALTSLLYAMDRVARTCGHYDAYRRGDPDDGTDPGEPAPGVDGNSELVRERRAGSRDADPDREREIRLLLPRIDVVKNRGNVVYQEDANRLIRRIEVDCLYLDPPYNSRQYSDTYHVLENVVLHDRPSLVGVARKRPGRPLRSRYCGREAHAAFAELIESARCRHIVFSYNNMADGDKRSNAILTEEQILDVLSRRGPVSIARTAFNSFTARRELVPGHEERVYVCRVETPPFPSVAADEDGVGGGSSAVAEKDGEEGDRS